MRGKADSLAHRRPRDLAADGRDGMRFLMQRFRRLIVQSGLTSTPFVFSVRCVPTSDGVRATVVETDTAADFEISRASLERIRRTTHQQLAAAMEKLPE